MKSALACDRVSLDRFYFLIIFIVYLLNSGVAEAQLLPKGVGAYSFGYRKYDSNAQLFTDQGELVPAGSKFDTSFTAADMASGKAGTDLKKLYDEMRKFDSENAGSALADEANFGQLNGQVTTDISGRLIGVGYGLTPDWTLFAAIPFVSAAVDTSLSFSGTNNALALKQKLGNLAYKELQDGLDKAATINGQMIKETIEITNEYEPLDHWQYTGLGDITFGAKTEIQGERRLGRRYTLALINQLELATGHADDPDILTDIGVGKGYHSVSTQANGFVTYDRTRFGVIAGLGLGMPTQVQKRVPADGESIVPKARKTSVNLRPGPDVEVGAYGMVGNSLLRGTYTLGVKKHFKDSMSGSLDGDYATLENETDKLVFYHEVQFTLTTTRAFTHKVFAFPFVVNLGIHDQFAGKNAAKQRYVELTVTSFFSTPAAKDPEPKSKRKSKKST